MEEPGRLQSMGLLRVGHDWATSLSLFTFMHGRRKWQPTPVFLSGESQGRGSLVATVCGITQSRTRLKWLSSSSRRRRHKLHSASICYTFEQRTRVLKNGKTPDLAEIISIILTVGSAHSIPDSFSGPMHPDSGDDPRQQNQQFGSLERKNPLGNNTIALWLFCFVFINSCEFSEGESRHRRPNSLGKAGKSFPSFPSCTFQDCGNDTMQVILPCMFSSENSECSRSDTASRTLTPSVTFRRIFYYCVLIVGGFPGGTSGKEPACQCRRHKRCKFNPRVRKNLWRRKWQPTPVFIPGEFHGQRRLVGYSP